MRVCVGSPSGEELASCRECVHSALADTAKEFYKVVVLTYAFRQRCDHQACCLEGFADSGRGVPVESYSTWTSYCMKLSGFIHFVAYVST